MKAKNYIKTLTCGDFFKARRKGCGLVKVINVFRPSEVHIEGCAHYRILNFETGPLILFFSFQVTQFLFDPFLTIFV